MDCTIRQIMENKDKDKHQLLTELHVMQPHASLLIEEQLRLSENKYRTIFENLQDVYYEISLDGIILEISPSIEALSKRQFKRDELIGRSIYDLYANKEDRENIIQALMSFGFVQDFEILFALSEGSTATCAVSAKLYFDEHNRPEKIIGTLRDISARKKLENDIQNSYEKFSGIFRLSPAAISIIDLEDEGRILECNEVYQNISGYSHAEIIGSTSEKLGMIVYPEQWKSFYSEILTNGSVYNLESQFNAKDGSIITGSVSAETVNLDGRLCAIVTVHNITEFKSIHSQLTESQTLLKSIIDSTTDMIWSVDAEKFGLLNWNNSLDEYFLFGRGIKIAVGMTPSDLFPGNSEYILFWENIYGKTLQIGSSSEQYRTYNGQRILLINTGLLSKGDKPFGVSIFAKDITERKQSEKTLQMSQDRLLEVLDNSLDASYKHNLINHTFEYLSPVFFRISGYTQEEINATSSKFNSDKIHTDDLQRFNSAINEALSGTAGNSCQIEYRFKHKSKDEYIWLLDKFTVMHDEQGKPISLIGSISDITERMKTRINLQELLNFETILTEISAILVKVKPNQLREEITKAQHLICEFLDLDLSSIYQPFSDSSSQLKLTYLYHRPENFTLPEILVASDYFPWCERNLLKGLKSIVHSMNDLPVDAARDRESWIQFGVKSSAMFPLIESDGQVMGTISFDTVRAERYFSDELINRLNLVSQLFANSLKRIKTEQVLSLSESKYRLIAEHSADVIWLLDPVNNCFKYISPSVFREWGYTPQEILELNPSEVLTMESLKAIDLSLVSENVSKDVPVYHKTMEVVQARKDGTSLFTELNTTFYYNEIGIPEVLGVSHNINDRKIAEKELIREKEKAEESDRLKTAFMLNISHEIRTPLNIILGFADLIIQPDVSHEEKTDYLSIVNSSSQRLINTITDYMDISRIVSGNMEVNISNVYIFKIIQELFNRYQKSFETKNLTFNFQHSSEIKNMILNTDEDLLGKALSHLLNNALKFTDKGVVTIGYEFKQKTVEIFINDTGIGISPIATQRIFETFMQENVSTTRPHEGSGLGLSIADGIIKLLGGYIRIESKKHHGTKVVVSFPGEVIAN